MFCSQHVNLERKTSLKHINMLREVIYLQWTSLALEDLALWKLLSPVGDNGLYLAYRRVGCVNLRRQFGRKEEKKQEKT